MCVLVWEEKILKTELFESDDITRIMSQVQTDQLWLRFLWMVCSVTQSKIKIITIQ